MRRVRRLLVTAVTVCAVAVPLTFAASASAWSWSQAWNATWSANWSACNDKTAPFYYCAVANSMPPQCYLVNESANAGQTQWSCLSAFIQGPRYPGIPYVGSYRHCDEQDLWGPYGGRTSPQNISCYNIGGIG